MIKRDDPKHSTTQQWSTVHENPIEPALVVTLHEDRLVIDYLGCTLRLPVDLVVDLRAILLDVCKVASGELLQGEQHVDEYLDFDRG